MAQNWQANQKLTNSLKTTKTKQLTWNWWTRQWGQTFNCWKQTKLAHVWELISIYCGTEDKPRTEYARKRSNNRKFPNRLIRYWKVEIESREIVAFRSWPCPPINRRRVLNIRFTVHRDILLHYASPWSSLRMRVNSVFISAFVVYSVLSTAKFNSNLPFQNSLYNSGLHYELANIALYRCKYFQFWVDIF